MSVEPIELIWIFLWLLTALAFLPMERWAWLTVQDQRFSQNVGGRNGMMAALARWFLWTFRLLALTAFLMMALALPALFLPPAPPRALESLTDWQRTVQAVAGVVGLIGLFGACGAMLTIGVMSLRVWAGLRRRASDREGL